MSNRKLSLEQNRKTSNTSIGSTEVCSSACSSEDCSEDFSVCDFSLQSEEFIIPADKKRNIAGKKRYLVVRVVISWSEYIFIAVYI